MKRAPAAGNAPSVAPRVRRGYFESRYGQLHVHIAMPPGGGFDEATALLCVHSATGSARTFRRFLEIMARDRSGYAPDVPGFGESDAPHERATVADFAAGIGDFLDSMRFRHIDLLGYELGAAIVAELAAARSQQVRRVVLAGVPLFVEREAAQRSLPQSTEDGSHLLLDWRRVLESAGRGATLEIVAERFADRLQNGASAARACAALSQYAMREKLAAVTQPVLVLRPSDELREGTLRAREVLPRARLVELPDYGSAVFEVAPQVVAEVVREFLKG